MTEGNVHPLASESIATAVAQIVGEASIEALYGEVDNAANAGATVVQNTEADDSRPDRYLLKSEHPRNQGHGEPLFRRSLIFAILSQVPP